MKQLKSTIVLNDSKLALYQVMGNNGTSAPIKSIYKKIKKHFAINWCTLQ